MYLCSDWMEFFCSPGIGQNVWMEMREDGCVPTWVGVDGIHGFCMYTYATIFVVCVCVCVHNFVYLCVCLFVCVILCVSMWRYAFKPKEVNI